MVEDLYDSFSKFIDITNFESTRQKKNVVRQTAILMVKSKIADT